MTRLEREQVKRVARLLGISEEQVIRDNAVEKLLDGLKKLSEEKKAEKEDADKEKDSEG